MDTWARPVYDNNVPQNIISYEISFGDKPFGNMWVKIPSRPSVVSTWDGNQWITPDAASQQDTRAQLTIDSIDRLQFRIAFNIENRVRVLEGKAPITQAVYRQAIIDLWKTLNP